MTDRYRKKPVEVRAWKIGFDGQEPDWVREAFDGERIDWCPAGEWLYINTLEGRMKAGIGDMLIEGVKGELYGCRADIFAATYEPVETTLAAQQPAAVDGAIDKARFERAPCYLCGYNGPGYYRPDTHPCAAKYHAALEELHLAEVRVQELARKTLGAQNGGSDVGTSAQPPSERLSKGA